MALFTGKSDAEAWAILLLAIMFVWLVLWGSFKRGVDASQMSGSIERTRANLGLPPTWSNN